MEPLLELHSQWNASAPPPALVASQAIASEVAASRGDGRRRSHSAAFEDPRRAAMVPSAPNAARKRGKGAPAREERAFVAGYAEDRRCRPCACGRPIGYGESRVGRRSGATVEWFHVPCVLEAFRRAYATSPTTSSLSASDVEGLDELDGAAQLYVYKCIDSQNREAADARAAAAATTRRARAPPPARRPTADPQPNGGRLGRPPRPPYAAPLGDIGFEGLGMSLTPPPSPPFPPRAPPRPSTLAAVQVGASPATAATGAAPTPAAGPAAAILQGWWLDAAWLRKASAVA